MKITSVSVREFGRSVHSKNRLLAYSTVVLEDEIAIHDIKIIDGSKGMFVQMPSKKVQAQCPCCKYKNFVLAKFCNECGAKIALPLGYDKYGNPLLYTDILHPICPEFRQEFSEAVLDAYDARLEELEKGQESVPPPAPASPK